MGDGGGGGRGSGVMGGGRDACVGSGGVNGRNCYRLTGVLQELCEDFPYRFPFFLKFLPTEGVVGVGDVSLIKLQRSTSSISSLVSISKISSVTFVIVEGS